MTINRKICPPGLRNNPNKNLTAINFITVHATGNYAATATAKNHADYLYNGSAGAQASWHYTVDSNSIWQSFEDHQACYHNKEHSAIDKTPETAYQSSKTPLRFLPPDTIAKAFLRLEQRKVDKSGCISFGGKKYEVGVIYIGRTVDVVYDPADVSVLTVEDNHFNTSFRVKELVVGEHTGPRPKLPDYMTPTQPLTSRLLDEKQKQYDQRQLSAKRAISYTQINKGGDGNV